MDSGKATDNPKKEQKDDGVLNLQPEVPAQNENDNKGNTPVTSPTKDDNTINIGPDNGTIVNNPTSGKIRKILIRLYKYQKLTRIQLIRLLKINELFKSRFI